MIIKHKLSSSTHHEPKKLFSFSTLSISHLLTHKIIKNFAYLGPDIAVVSDQIIKVDTTALHNEVRKMRMDEVHPPPPAFDDLRNYAFEGSGSTAGSLSSVLDSSGTRIKYDHNKHSMFEYS